VIACTGRFRIGCWSHNPATLAAAGRSEQRDEGIIRDIQVDAVDRRDLAVARVGVGVADLSPLHGGQSDACWALITADFGQIDT
jgi:hypothetical protein